MREREINELILQIFEEQEEIFFFPINSQKDAKAFVKALNSKGLGYEKLCDDLGESEHIFNSWRKSLGRTGVGQRVIERINQPFIELLEEDADQLMQGTTVNNVHASPMKIHNGCQNGISPKQSPVRPKKESPSPHKQENESELAERLNRARHRLQESSKKSDKKKDDDKDDGSEEEVFATSNSSQQNSTVTASILRREEKTNNERPISQIEEVRMNLRRSSGSIDAKLREIERRSSLRDKDTNGDGVIESRNSVHGLLQKFENIADSKKTSNSVSPCGSGSKSNSEENINEVSQGSEFRHRSPSPTMKLRSPLRSPVSSPRSGRSSQSPTREVTPIKEIECEITEQDESEKEESESRRERESESAEKNESKSNESENRRESESRRERDSESAEKIESKGKDSENRRERESESTEKIVSQSTEKIESKSTEKNESESKECENRRESESVEKRTESESDQRNDSVTTELVDCDSFVTANGSQREDEYCSFDEGENGEMNHVDAQNEDDTSSDTLAAPMSPRESLKEKEERLAEQVKAEVSNLRKQVKDQFEAAKKKKVPTATLR